MALVPALAGGGRSRLRLLASTAFAVLRNAANASRAARGPRGSAVYTLGTNSGASPWRVGLESLSLLSAMPFALAAASAAAMGFGAEISTREEKCTLIPSHDRAWCPLPRSQTRNIPGNASLWTRITPSNATHSRERVATDLHTHAHFAQHSRERVAYLSYAMQKAARLVGRPEAYSRVSAAHPRSLAHCCLVLA